MRLNPTLKLISLLSLIAALVSGCQNGGTKTSATPVAVAVTPTSYTVVAGKVDNTVETSAATDPARTTNLMAETRGTVATVPKVGQKFAAGQVVAQLDPKDAQRSLDAAQIRVAQAELAATKAQSAAASAEAQWTADQTLFAKGGLTNQQLADSKAAWTNAGFAVQGAALDLSSAHLALAQAREDLASTKIKAPYAGVVLSVATQQGTYLESKDPVAVFADLSRIKLTGEIDEYDIGKLKEGTPVKVTIETLGNREWQTKIDTISPAATLQNNIPIFILTAYLNNPLGEIRPGMNAQLVINTGGGSGLVVPKAAVQTRGDKAFVLIKPAGAEKPERREITTGADDGKLILVVSGLQAGEVIQANGPLNPNETNGQTAPRNNRNPGPNDGPGGFFGGPGGGH